MQLLITHCEQRSAFTPTTAYAHCLLQVSVQYARENLWLLTSFVLCIIAFFL